MAGFPFSCCKYESMTDIFFEVYWLEIEFLGPVKTEHFSFLSLKGEEEEILADLF